MNNVIPFKTQQEILICGHCYDEQGLFNIGIDFVAFCSECCWTVRLKSSPYPDWRKIEEIDKEILK
jgi:hypothetical protein